MITPLNLSAALDALMHPNPLPVRETEGEKIGPRWVELALHPREIRAVVLQMKLQDLQILMQGNISDGGIVLHTKETLYWTDSDNTEATGRQSYVTYQGYEYRVIGTGFSLGNANYNTYNAVRFRDA